MRTPAPDRLPLARHTWPAAAASSDSRLTHQAELPASTEHAMQHSIASGCKPWGTRVPSPTETPSKTVHWAAASQPPPGGVPRAVEQAGQIACMNGCACSQHCVGVPQPCIPGHAAAPARRRTARASTSMPSRRGTALMPAGGTHEQPFDGTHRRPPSSAPPPRPMLRRHAIHAQRVATHLAPRELARVALTRVNSPTGSFVEHPWRRLRANSGKHLDSDAPETPKKSTSGHLTGGRRALHIATLPCQLAPRHTPGQHVKPLHLPPAFDRRLKLPRAEDVHPEHARV
jgi:hypothetical protein